MKKCPRCHQPVDENHQYCPHCGLNLKKNNSMKQRMLSRFILYGLVLFLFAGVPLMYTYLFTSLTDSDMSSVLTQNDSSTLPEQRDVTAQRIIAEYHSLDNFNKAYTNVSSMQDAVTQYESSLEDKLGTTFDKDYTIQVLDNYNVLIRLKYTVHVSDNTEMVLTRIYDRSFSYNDEEVSFTKKNVSSFDALFLNDEELSYMNQLVEDTSGLNTLMQDFSAREEEFNAKKKTLGHYGMGEYQDKSSFVVKRYGNAYESVLTYGHDATDKLGEE